MMQRTKRAKNFLPMSGIYMVACICGGVTEVIFYGSFTNHWVPHDEMQAESHAHARTWRSAELQRALETRGLKVSANTKLRFSPVWELMGVTAQKL